MADLTQHEPGDPIRASVFNALIAQARNATNPMVRKTGVGFGDTYISPDDNGQIVRLAKITKFTKEGMENIFKGENATIEPLTEEENEPNAVLMMYDPESKKWQEQPDTTLTVFIKDDGDDTYAGALPLIVGDVVPVYYSKTAQAWFPLEQPRSYVVHVTSSEADPNAVQDGEIVIRGTSSWIVRQTCKIIRIGV